MKPYNFKFFITLIIAIVISGIILILINDFRIHLKEKRIANIILKEQQERLDAEIIIKTKAAAEFMEKMEMFDDSYMKKTKEHIMKIGAVKDTISDVGKKILNTFVMVTMRKEILKIKNEIEKKYGLNSLDDVDLSLYGIKE
jgi:hypothetical protein